MLALTVESAKNDAVIVVIVLIAIALLIARFVSGVVLKAVSLLLFAALALGVWTQRQSLQACADTVVANAATKTATCTFFGKQVTIETPQTG